MYYLTSGQQANRGMKIALALACAVHLGLIIGITFEPLEATSYSPQIDVTLAMQPSRLAPDNATPIAQANQRGVAEQADIEPLSPAQAPPPAARAESRAGMASVTPTARTNTDRRVQPAPEPTPLDGISPEVDALTRELDELQARLDRQSHAYSNLPRVRRLTSVAARESADAAYLRQWRQRVESVGNKYYPEASVRYGIYGSLRLLVVIRYDGRLEDIRVLSSSGFAVLDEAALKIVRMAAPFSPFPRELRAVADRVEIIRTWQFEENRLSSG